MKFKNFSITLFLCIFFQFANSQTFINENFDTGIPQNWTFSSNQTNWVNSISNNAGGESPELKFYWEPSFTGISRFISPVLDVSGYKTVYLSFKYNVKHYATFYYIGVDYRTDATNWKHAWSNYITTDIEKNKVSISIAISDTSNKYFQFCFYFDGETNGIDALYIDDIELNAPKTNDIKILEIINNEQYKPTDTVQICSKIENRGLQTENSKVGLEIFQMPDTVKSIFKDTISYEQLNPDNIKKLCFKPFVGNQADILYKIKVTSLLSNDSDTSNDILTSYFNTYNIQKNYVLLEEGTGTWCVYCPYAARIIDTLTTNYEDIAVISYHDFDIFETEEAKYRINNVYKMTGYPSTIFDGQYKLEGGNATYNEYLNNYLIQKSKKSPFAIDFNGTKKGKNYILKTNVSRKSEYLYNDLTLHVVVIETDIPYPWKDLEIVDYCQRLMLPDSVGTHFDTKGSKELSFENSFTLDPSWNSGKCEIIAFIQREKTKEIIQTNKISVNDFQNSNILNSSNTDINIYPNPANDYIQISANNDQLSEISIFDLSGKKVIEKKFNNNISLNIKYLQSGIYTIKITDKNNVVIKKLIKE